MMPSNKILNNSEWRPPVEYFVFAGLVVVVMPMFGLPAMYYMIKAHKQAVNGHMSHSWADCRTALLLITAGLMTIALAMFVWILVIVQQAMETARLSQQEQTNYEKLRLILKAKHVNRSSSTAPKAMLEIALNTSEPKVMEIGAETGNIKAAHIHEAPATSSSQEPTKSELQVLENSTESTPPSNSSVNATDVDSLLVNSSDTSRIHREQKNQADENKPSLVVRKVNSTILTIFEHHFDEIVNKNENGTDVTQYNNHPVTEVSLDDEASGDVYLPVFVSSGEIFSPELSHNADVVQTSGEDSLTDDGIIKNLYNTADYNITTILLASKFNTTPAPMTESLNSTTNSLFHSSIISDEQETYTNTGTEYMTDTQEFYTTSQWEMARGSSTVAPGIDENNNTDNNEVSKTIYRSGGIIQKHRKFVHKMTLEWDLIHERSKQNFLNSSSNSIL